MLRANVDGDWADMVLWMLQEEEEDDGPRFHCGSLRQGTRRPRLSSGIKLEEVPEDEAAELDEAAKEEL